MCLSKWHSAPKPKTIRGRIWNWLPFKRFFSSKIEKEFVAIQATAEGEALPCPSFAEQYYPDQYGELHQLFCDVSSSDLDFVHSVVYYNKTSVQESLDLPKSHSQLPNQSGYFPGNFLEKHDSVLLSTINKVSVSLAHSKKKKVFGHGEDTSGKLLQVEANSFRLSLSKFQFSGWFMMQCSLMTVSVVDQFPNAVVSEVSMSASIVGCETYPYSDEVHVVQRVGQVVEYFDCHVVFAGTGKNAKDGQVLLHSCPKQVCSLQSITAEERFQKQSLADKEVHVYSSSVVGSPLSHTMPDMELQASQTLLQKSCTISSPLADMAVDPTGSPVPSMHLARKDGMDNISRKRGRNLKKHQRNVQAVQMKADAETSSIHRDEKPLYMYMCPRAIPTAGCSSDAKGTRQASGKNGQSGGRKQTTTGASSSSTGQNNGTTRGCQGGGDRPPNDERGNKVRIPRDKDDDDDDYDGDDEDEDEDYGNDGQIGQLRVFGGAAQSSASIQTVEPDQQQGQESGVSAADQEYTSQMSGGGDEPPDDECGEKVGIPWDKDEYDDGYDGDDEDEDYGNNGWRVQPVVGMENRQIPMTDDNKLCFSKFLGDGAGTNDGHTGLYLKPGDVNQPARNQPNPTQSPAGNACSFAGGGKQLEKTSPRKVTKTRPPSRSQQPRSQSPIHDLSGRPYFETESASASYQPTVRSASTGTSKPLSLESDSPRPEPPNVFEAAARSSAGIQSLEPDQQQGLMSPSGRRNVGARESSGRESRVSAADREDFSLMREYLVRAARLEPDPVRKRELQQQADSLLDDDEDPFEEDSRDIG